MALNVFYLSQGDFVAIHKFVLSSEVSSKVGFEHILFLASFGVVAHCLISTLVKLGAMWFFRAFRDSLPGFSCKGKVINPTYVRASICNLIDWVFVNIVLHCISRKSR